MAKRAQAITSLMILSVLLGGLVGCVPAGTQPPSPPAATSVPTLPPAQPTIPSVSTLPAGWETYDNQGQCGYTISHPSDMDGASQDTYSWILSPTAGEPGEAVPNFIYVSVIPDDFQGGEPGIIYNYDPAEAGTLLNMQVGESRSLRDFDPNLAPWFTYTRLPDTILNNQTAQTYENTQPWEFPPGTKEIRYYLKADSCTYLIGGYMATVGSDQPGGIDEELFDQIIATFRPAL